MLSPQDPITAVTHYNPYPYYADLVARLPIYRDETARLWIASSAATVTAVLTSNLCLVRPPTEPVPGALLDSPAADIFSRLVRMNDGTKHDYMKSAVSSTLQTISIQQLSEQSTAWARRLADELRPEASLASLSDFMFQLPVCVVASLLGILRELIHQTTLWMGDFVRCLSPLSSPEQLEQAKRAAGHLQNLIYTLFNESEDHLSDSLPAILLHEAERVGVMDRDVVVANAIGLLSQTYEATAGLIGNTLLALAKHEDVYEQVLADPGLLPPVIQEVLRYDPPIQNTRRFLAGNGVVAGEEMNEGDSVLVVLAAANRDPAGNRDPDCFDIFREDRRLFTFGVGSHLCPGQELAVSIARAGIAQLLSLGINLKQLSDIDSPMGYRPSVNARVPLFAGGKL